MSRREDDCAHGVTEREREVLDRADAGLHRDRIAREVGVKRSYVDQLIRMYSINDTAHQRWVSAAAIANGVFLSAITASGKSYS